MELKSKVTEGVCKVCLQGDLSIYYAADVKGDLVDIISDVNTNEIEINLGEVSEIDTAGLQLLIMAKKETQRMEKLLSLVAHSPSVIEIIELYNMESFFGDPLVVDDK